MLEMGVYRNSKMVKRRPAMFLPKALSMSLVIKMTAPYFCNL